MPSRRLAQAPSLGYSIEPPRKRTAHGGMEAEVGVVMGGLEGSRGLRLKSRSERAGSVWSGVRNA